MDDAKIPYISVMTDPTTGGVTASFAMLGDLGLAGPGALHRLCRPPRHRADHPPELPEGSRRSSSLLGHGFLDAIVASQRPRSYYLTQALTWTDERI